MNMLINTMLQERHRIEYMLNRYYSELEELPKGSVYEKKSNGKVYYYLKYRNKGRVISQYVCKNDVEDIKQKVERRRHIEAMIKSLQEEKSIADSALEGRI